MKFKLIYILYSKLRKKTGIQFSDANAGLKFLCDTIPFWLLDGAKYQGGAEAKERGADEQPLSDKPPLTRCGEIYSA